MKKNLLPAIYKPSGRYSESRKPPIGTKCIFSPCIKLTSDIFCSQSKMFDRDEIHPGAICEVRSLTPHLVLAHFPGASQDDLISPEFLMKAELTKFGEALMTSKGSAENVNSIIRNLQ